MEQFSTVLLCRRVDGYGRANAGKKKIGDSVIAGTLNTSGSFKFTATKVGSETLLAQIIKMVEEAQEAKLLFRR